MSSCRIFYDGLKVHILLFNHIQSRLIWINSFLRISIECSFEVNIFSTCLWTDTRSCLQGKSWPIYSCIFYVIWTLAYVKFCAQKWLCLRVGGSLLIHLFHTTWTHIEYLSLLKLFGNNRRYTHMLKKKYEELESSSKFLILSTAVSVYL